MCIYGTYLWSIFICIKIENFLFLINKRSNKQHVTMVIKKYYQIYLQYFMIKWHNFNHNLKSLFLLLLMAYWTPNELIMMTHKLINNKVCWLPSAQHSVM